jgi:hypothetical protein
MEILKNQRLSAHDRNTRVLTVNSVFMRNFTDFKYADITKKVN